MPLNPSPNDRIFEYSCHEGNYGLENTPRGGRADEADEDDEVGDR